MHRLNIRKYVNQILPSSSLVAGLCILFELKKKVDSQHLYQALCQLLLANILSPSHREWVVMFIACGMALCLQLGSCYMSPSS